MKLNMGLPHYNYNFYYNFCAEPYETGRHNTKGWPDNDLSWSALRLYTVLLIYSSLNCPLMFLTLLCIFSSVICV